MPFLTSSDKTIIEQSIEELLLDHIANPFGILRETGIQAELRQKILARLAKISADYVQAQIVYVGKKPIFVWGQPLQTKRVQLEMKVGLPRKNDEDPKQRSDLVVLSANSPVTLTCYPGGPGDVVAAIGPGDVNAAIEIKASPSHSTGERKKYIYDINKLLDLLEQGIDGFFVLLDKSSPLYGSINRRRPAVALDLSKLLNGPEKVIAMSELPDNSIKSIQIWYIDAQNKPARVFVSRKPQCEKSAGSQLHQ